MLISASDLTVPLPRADGAYIGQRDRALVLDLLAQQSIAGRLDGFEDHEAIDLGSADFNAAWDSLVADGFVRADGLGHSDAITPAGLAVHAEAQNAVGDISAVLDGIADVIALQGARG